MATHPRQKVISYIGNFDKETHANLLTIFWTWPFALIAVNLVIIVNGHLYNLKMFVTCSQYATSDGFTFPLIPYQLPGPC